MEELICPICGEDIKYFVGTLELGQEVYEVQETFQIINKDTDNPCFFNRKHKCNKCNKFVNATGFRELKIFNK